MNKKGTCMHLSFWRPSLSRRGAAKRLVASAGVLALVVAALTTSLLITRSAAAAPGQQPSSSRQTQAGTIKRLEVFQNDNGVILHQWSDDNGANWHSWVPLDAAPGGRPFSGKPAVVSDGPARLNVFAKDDSSVLYVNTYNNGSWSGWNGIPGSSALNGTYTLIFDPAVSSWGPGRLDLFTYAITARTLAGVLLHTWAENGTWSGTWEVLDVGRTFDTPTAVSWGTGRIDVFVRGQDQQLWHRWFDNGSWSGWEELGGQLSSAPTVASWGPGRLDVYVRGQDQQLWHKWFDNGPWSGWEGLGGGLSSAPAVASLGVGHEEVFVRGTDTQLWLKRFDNAWGNWTGMWDSLFSDPAATVWVVAAPGC